MANDEPLTAEEEATLRRINAEALTPLPLPVRRLLATLDAARAQAAEAGGLDVETLIKDLEGERSDLYGDVDWGEGKNAGIDAAIELIRKHERRP